MEINQAKLKEILQEQRGEYQKYIGTISEDFQSQIKLIAESAEGMQKQLSAIRDMIARNTEDIAIIKTHIQFIKQELKHKIDRDEFEALEKRVLILERKR